MGTREKEKKRWKSEIKAKTRKGDKKWKEKLENSLEICKKWKRN